MVAAAEAAKAKGVRSMVAFNYRRVPAVGLARRLHAAFVDAVDLSGVRRLVDVGGGQGQLVTALLQRYPDMHAVAFDRPEVMTSTVIAPAGVAGRAELAAGDFFEGVPPGGDAYVLSSILHDWSDEEAGVILRNVRTAMAPGARVLAVDTVLPAGDAAHLGKLLDIAMLAQHSGRERAAAEHERLLHAAGLRLQDTVALPGLPTSVLVAVAP
jgi:trans-aconitate methyltransferase